MAAEVFPPDVHDTHHLWLKASLLTVWVVVTFGGAYFARVRCAPLRQVPYGAMSHSSTWLNEPYTRGSAFSSRSFTAPSGAVT